MAIDHVLKLYSETIQSPYLHYGFGMIQKP